MNRLLKRLEELQFDCCVVDSFNELCVELSDASHLQLSEETTLEIDRIWQNAQRQKPLNDDIVLYYLSHQTFGDECLISAFWGPYRYFYAKLSDPTLSIPIFPLAVSGICLNDVGQVLIGKRNGVSEYQDCYEFVPSGGLNNKYSTANSLNYKQQLIGEFKEETKLDQIIFSINTLGLVFDLVHEVYDICCSIFLAGSPRLPSNTSEYKGLEWAALNDTKIEMVIPTSRALLSLFNGSH
jgi:hypothetical protein